MGVVYRARDVALDRDVAVKLLSQRYPPDSLPAQRFLSEAHIAGQLQHPGIPAVHQVGTLRDGRPFLAMKLIRGSTLEAILKRRTDPAAERGRLLAIFEAACQAVGFAHAHRVIHRDLKPANVMVGSFGEVQVMDWGLAKVLGEQTSATTDELAAVQTQAWTEVHSTPELASQTQAGSLVGTPAFISPEQAVGEIERVNERSDVFGLGALLAVILTGKPPYVGESYESVRVQAVRGTLADCFARLDASGAESEWVALCKQCLAFEPADRPADAGAVATAVAELRAAADERARRAELDKVRVEGEKAASEARAVERRKRRRLAAVAAAVLTMAVVGGLTAVLAVQRQANANLTATNRELADEQAKVQAKNVELADEQAKVRTKNVELAEEQAKVQARFDMAARAIAMFHTGVSEDMLLKNAEFKVLRTKLLKEAAAFYADLEKLLAGQTDAKSRQALAAAYFQLGELTDKIGDKQEALEVHRKALALRRELAATAGTDAQNRLDVARSVAAVGGLLKRTGDHAGALAAFEEQRELTERLAAEHSTDAVRSRLASSHHNIASELSDTGKLGEALASYRKALAIEQNLADANPAVSEFQSDLAASHDGLGAVLWLIWKPEEALASFREGLAIRQKLADANPTVTKFQGDLAASHINIGALLILTGKLEEALASNRQALAIEQKLADANPAVTDFQRDLAANHFNIGDMLREIGKPEEALASYRQALAIDQKLADANPAVTDFQRGVAWSHNNIGLALARSGKSEEALASQRTAEAIWQKLADAKPFVTVFQDGLAWTHIFIGLELARTGKPEEALKSIEDRFQRMKAVHGPNHFATLAALDGVALGYLALATQQAWLGQDQEWAATCDRGLALARDTKSASLAERVAKICCLRPSNDDRRQAALLLARRAVELGKGKQHLAWYQMALGMAEYRSGHYAEADAALRAAMEAGKGNPHVDGTSAFYRALTLFRQGRPDEAKQLATLAAAKMKPLPEDARNPQPGGANHSHDDLILWLAYREAKDAIKLEQKSRVGAERELRNKAETKEQSP
jgi:tetratricopeptide (TPR) repeat protein/tRNA A-37 threonylcarbamoyl transferase component Bud32